MYVCSVDGSRWIPTCLGIKDTYVVCKYVKKTVLELGFIWVWVLDPASYLLGQACVPEVSVEVLHTVLRFTERCVSYV
jgi:hypothetical protein